ncbi:MAG TPA: TlpA disulfide reductase family protein [Mariprofundaceae bacterium]|nr:TlpA disulfide reductase family protein [Mariprofundaceae bacterium]
MQRLLIVLAVLLLGALPAQATDFKWQDQAGKTHSLAEYRGKAVVLHLWASWCPPCRSEMPELADWLKKHPNVTFIPVSLDSRSQDAVDFLQQQHISLPVLVSDESQAYGVGARGLPTTVAVDASGKIRHLWLGVQDWQSPAWNQELLSDLR